MVIKPELGAGHAVVAVFAKRPSSLPLEPNITLRQGTKSMCIWHFSKDLDEECFEKFSRRLKALGALEVTLATYAEHEGKPN